MKNLFFPLFFRKSRFLIAGCWNTLFGYSANVIIYSYLNKYIHISFILIISNILSITMAFLTYKLFVFRSKGSWIKEYFRSYLVYGASAIIGILSVIILVSFFSLKFWLAQAIAIPFTVFFSYFSHKNFTFKLEK